MSALFVYPLPFTVSSANQATLAPASNANSDEPGLVYRSSNLTTPFVILDLGAGSLSYDTVAIVGTNLRAADTVQIRTGATNTGIGSYAGSAIAAWSGTLPSGSTAISIHKLATTRTERFVRIDFVATSHPDTYVQAQRIVVGKALSTAGFDMNSEHGFVDQSVANNGPGWVSFDEYPVPAKWKISLSWISDTAWRSDWYPFLQRVGKKKAILFIADDTAPANYQTDTIFGNLMVDAVGKVVAYDMRNMELTIQARSQ